MKSLKILLILVFGFSLMNCIPSYWGKYKKVRGNGNIITQTMTFDGYKGVEINGDIDVELVEGTEGEITITADSNLYEFLDVIKERENLIVRFKKGYNLQPSKTIKIIVPVEEISKLGIAGSGSINASTILKTENLKLSIAGSGDIKASIEVNEINASIAGSGDIRVSGIARKSNVSIAGSGDYKGEALKVKEGSVKIAGSGDVKIDAEDYLTVEIAGSGDVRYKGNPQTKLRTSGSGSASSF